MQDAMMVLNSGALALVLPAAHSAKNINCRSGRSLSQSLYPRSFFVTIVCVSAINALGGVFLDQPNEFYCCCPALSPSIYLDGFCGYLLVRRLRERFPLLKVSPQKSPRHVSSRMLHRYRTVSLCGWSQALQSNPRFFPSESATSTGIAGRGWEQNSERWMDNCAVSVDKGCASSFSIALVWFRKASMEPGSCGLSAPQHPSSTVAPLGSSKCQDKCPRPNSVSTSQAEEILVKALRFGCSCYVTRLTFCRGPLNALQVGWAAGGLEDRDSRIPYQDSRQDHRVQDLRRDRPHKPVRPRWPRKLSSLAYQQLERSPFGVSRPLKAPTSAVVKGTFAGRGSRRLRRKAAAASELRTCHLHHRLTGGPEVRCHCFESCEARSDCRLALHETATTCRYPRNAIMRRLTRPLPAGRHPRISSPLPPVDQQQMQGSGNGHYGTASPGQQLNNKTTGAGGSATLAQHQPPQLPSHLNQEQSQQQNGFSNKIGQRGIAIRRGFETADPSITRPLLTGRNGGATALTMDNRARRRFHCCFFYATAAVPMDNCFPCERTLELSGGRHGKYHQREEAGTRKSTARS
ncbi:hypothetical protein BIW11_02450 [Tropilaelaps mercedesae]|uniref:Uncharacterized protein n=1 Tax=Tropilaelaps mercedesae TaxID=418985 RepID=A0A1V9Y2Z0_9ACAR|nr:hypothetical protein BIW11_02450 [Tropilaelaps mercedesae]